jgi:hypothetical protein
VAVGRKHWKMKAVTVRLPASCLEYLERVKKERGVPKSRVVAEALEGHAYARSMDPCKPIKEMNDK